MKFQILLVASTISAYPINLSDLSTHTNSINQVLLPTNDNNIQIIRRANRPIQYVGQSISNFGTSILGGLTGGVLTNNYRDTGLVAGLRGSVNGLLQTIFDKGI
jgi:hypothetical protein